MNDTVLITIISNLVTLVGVLMANSKKMAVIETELRLLTDEVKKHNNFATRVPVIEEQIKVANHRLDDLERKIA